VRHRIAIAFSIVTIGTTAVAQRPATTREPMIVTTAQLAARLNDPNLVLLHVGDSAEYAAKHIAGALYVSPADVAVSDPNGLTLELPSDAVLRDRLATLGISDDSRIVIYYGKDRVTPTTRIILTLDHAGFGDRVALLDGGMQQWMADGHDVTAAVPPARMGKLSALHTRPVTVDADFVRARLNRPGVSIIDARATTFYDGTQTGRGIGGPHRTGHIAGAKNIPYTEITDSTFHVKSAAELQAVFGKAGVAPSDTIVAYCHIGQQATGIVFAARLLNRPVVLYDGSFEDWSKHVLTDFPVEARRP
jgi:thiosulfate/3-mercaptopyruvate sulfurtransferase